jgi:hypothetical protein
MHPAAGLAAALAWTPLPSATLERTEVAAARIGDSIYVAGGFVPAGMTTAAPRHGLGGAALGRRVFALEGGPSPGFAFSDALETLVVPPRR